MKCPYCPEHDWFIGDVCMDCDTEIRDNESQLYSRDCTNDPHGGNN